MAVATKKCAKPKAKGPCCADCGKEAPPHIVSYKDYLGKPHSYKCCVCFLYWATYKLWSIVTKDSPCRQLCLFCLRKRAGRKLKRTDFTQCMDLSIPDETEAEKMKRMVAYANSGVNDSVVW